ncbi:MAG: ATP-binding protein, partial [Candidatus Omnitrophica bacterium]|nr:ATP-binding protein [Candidatus Omnitrophota bacterium]
CPCGYLGDRTRTCRCSVTSVRRYLNKISGPLLDRIDIHLDVPALKTQELLSAPQGENSTMIRQRVLKTRACQLKRFKNTPVTSNARMTPKLLKTHCSLDKECRDLMGQAIEGLGLSARAHDKILKVARTIADMAESEKIKPEHLAEAISYRNLDRINT